MYGWPGLGPEFVDVELRGHEIRGDDVQDGDWIEITARIRADRRVKWIRNLTTLSRVRSKNFLFTRP
jgi:hypothetical protein